MAVVAVRDTPRRVMSAASTSPYSTARRVWREGRQSRRPSQSGGRRGIGALPEAVEHAVREMVSHDSLLGLLAPPSSGVEYSPSSAILESVQNFLLSVGGNKNGVTSSELPTGSTIQAVVHPIQVFYDGLLNERSAVGAGESVPASSWSAIIQSVGTDALVFLGVVVVIVPPFRLLGQAPVTGFLLAGLGLAYAGLFRDNREVDSLCELGIQFLLFEMGLELRSDRLKALSKYAFGLGLGQVALTSLLFSALLLPAGNAIGTKVLMLVQPLVADSKIIEIRTILEAVVIGFALSLSSSAFALQMLQDRKLLGTRFGTAALGVLLFQDISVVPFIVLLPVVQRIDPDSAVNLSILTASGLTEMLDLGVLAVLGRQVVLSGFRFVDSGENTDDVFLAMSLLTVAAFSQAAAALGFSATLGAFLAGIVLADTAYSSRIIENLKQLKGLFLALFFVTVGSTIDLPLVTQYLPIVLFMSASLILGKIGVTTLLAPTVGLNWREGLVAGAALSQGGEFAFVIFGQASAGDSIFPHDLDRILVAVVVVTMAMTPTMMDLAILLVSPELECTDIECDTGREMQALLEPRSDRSGVLNASSGADDIEDLTP